MGVTTGPTAPDVSSGVTGDTAASATLPDKSGNTPAATLTIRLVNENTQPGAEGEALDEFLRLVDELSGGAMKVEILSTSRLPNEVWDQQRGPDAHTQAVIAGEADLGFIGNNYWGYEGVTTTQAAEAPLLIRSAEQAVAIAEDAELVADLFAGLHDVGVVGLEMFPQNFKVLVSFDGPVASPADVTGKVLQSRAAPELYRFFEALGAVPQQDTAGRQLYVAPPWIQADWGEGLAIGNLPIYFVYYDLVANEEFWSGLSDDQRTVLTNAAARAQDFAVANLPEDESAAELAAYCRRGSAVEHLDDTALAEFEAAAASTIDGPEAELVVSELIARITAHGEGTAPTIYPKCGSEQQASASGPEPNGVYRFEITDDDLREVDIPSDQWPADVGVFTVTMKDGNYSWTQQSPGSPPIGPGEGGYDGGGTYQVDGDSLTIVETAFGEPVTTSLMWTLTDDRALDL